jgi:hypothetical protein
MEKDPFHFASELLLCGIVLVLVGCGGGPFWSKVCNPSDDGCSIATVGGTLSGLSSGEWVQLVNDGFDNLTVTKNGAFTFPTQLTNTSNYDVVVKSESPGVTCAVDNGNGLVGFNGVTSVLVSCASSGP